MEVKASKLTPLTRKILFFSAVLLFGMHANGTTFSDARKKCYQGNSEACDEMKILKKKRVEESSGAVGKASREKRELKKCITRESPQSCLGYLARLSDPIMNPKQAGKAITTVIDQCSLGLKKWCAAKTHLAFIRYNKSLFREIYRYSSFDITILGCPDKIESIKVFHERRSATPGVSCKGSFNVVWEKPWNCMNSVQFEKLYKVKTKPFAPTCAGNIEQIYCKRFYKCV